ncbi:P-loop containing nucleoside triphosphate hydrolase protein [Xylariaceae sp. FL0594]|nr:P-loop containing nucleoside triphosphate hydrolase protein [Xylariaceae sp. FL0594]
MAVAPLKAAAAPIATSAAGGFVPRTVFYASDSITRSYYLGHHRAALMTMEKTLSNIGLVIECRDSRVPITSTNPLLESTLAGRDRIIVYTKSKLIAPKGRNAHRFLENQLGDLKRWHIDPSSPVYTSTEGSSRGAGGGRTDLIFTDVTDERSISKLLSMIRKRGAEYDSLLGLRALVVGMPNVGKSSLLNAIRHVGMNLGKAAKTGAQPGVTRKLSTPVRITPSASSSSANDSSSPVQDFGEGIFLVDTPGVFIPYVSDVTSMLKLALVGCVGYGIIPSETLVDYLLFHLNLRDPSLYAQVCPTPTNDVDEFLRTAAIRRGALKKGGEPNIPDTANYILQQWRTGRMGSFMLDDTSDEALRERAKALAEKREDRISMNQARKREKEARKEKYLAKRAAALGGSAV